jgi:hypothetical protein
MGSQPMGKVPDLRRLAGRVASRSTVRWPWLWTCLGFCLLASVVGGPAVGLPHAQVAAAVAGISPSARGPTSLPQAIAFDQPPDTTVGQQIMLAASSVTTTSPPEGTGLPVSFRSDTPAMCTISGSIATPTAPGFCVITATQGGDGIYAPAPDVARAFRARAGPEPQTITFDQPAAAAVGQPVVLTAASVALTSPPVQTRLTVLFRSDTPGVCTVSDSTVTPTTADVCTITAFQGGSDRYAAARPVQRSFQAHAGTVPQTITFGQLPRDVIVGQQVTLSASTDADEPLVVSFRSGSPLVCTVSGSTVTAVAVGTCAITAFQGGSAIYAPAQASTRFQVIVTTHRSPQQISFGPVPGATVGVPVVLTASSWTQVFEGPDSPTGLPVSYSARNPRVCTVSGATVVPWTAGLCVITASQPGGAQYFPAKPVTQVFPVARAPQTISFTPPASATIGQPVVLTATASSWLPVTYASSTPDVCTVSGATVAATAAGTCIIVASQPGDDQYAPANPVVAGSFPVQKITQTISFSPPASATVGQPVALTATASSGLPVTYTSNSTDVCTVSGSTLTPAKAGTCIIVASQPGDDQYAPANPVVAGSFPVQKITQTISFTSPNGAEAGQRVALSASATSKLAVSFTSDTPGVCTVSGSTAATVKAGTCAITAGQAGNDRYAAAEPVRKSFPVARIPQTIDFPQPPDVTFGQPVTLTATASSGLPVRYRMSTPDVCTVSGRTVTTMAARACIITASQPGNDRYAPARDVARSFLVERAAQTITFTPPDSAAIGQPVTLAASASSGLAVSYRTDTPAVCTVSGSTVSPATVGICAITASQPGNGNYAAAPQVSQSFPVHRGTVGHGKTRQAITFRRPLATAVGRRITLAASASSGLGVSFRSDTPSVCTVSGAIVTATAAGTCAITASQPGNGNYAAARDVRRSFAVHARPHGDNNGNEASQAISFGQPSAAAVGQLVPLSASATSGLAVSFSSDTPAVCSVSGTIVTTVTAGTCAVTASQPGSARYLAAPDVTQSFQVHAGHQAQTITFPRPPEGKVGEAATLLASATSELPVAFRSDTPRICTVSGSTLTPTAAGTCTVTANQGGSDHYAAAHEVDQSFDVASAASIPTGVLTILLGAVVFAAAGVTALVRRVRRPPRPPLGPQPTVRAAPVPGPPALVSVQKNGAGVTHTVHIESSPGASITRIKEARP